MLLEKIAIISGEDLLPKIIESYFFENKIKYKIIGLNGHVYKYFKPDLLIDLGDFSKLLKFLKNNNINSVVFAGKIKFPGLKNIKLSFKLLIIFIKIFFSKNHGDDFLLHQVINIFESYKINIIPVQDILPDLLISDKDQIFSNDLNDKLKKDILLGKFILESISNLDIGQSIVMQDKRVLGMEAAEGTAELIKRCSDYKLKNSYNKPILVKIPKINQQMKIDVPTIGEDTINDIIKYDYAGIAIKKNSVLIIDKEKIIKKIKNHNINLIILD